jgi:hypothetical protein
VYRGLRLLLLRVVRHILHLGDASPIRSSGDWEK